MEQSNLAVETDETRRNLKAIEKAADARAKLTARLASARARHDGQADRQLTPLGELRAVPGGRPHIVLRPVGASTS